MLGEERSQGGGAPDPLKPTSSGGGRRPGGAWSSRRRLWWLGRTGVEEEAATAPHPVALIYGENADRIFRFKFEPDIPIEPDIPVQD